MAGSVPPADRDDEALFLDAVAGTEPLSDRDQRVARSPRLAPRPTRPRARSSRSGAFVVERDGERVEGRAPGVSRAQVLDAVGAIGSGIVQPRAHLDLHRCDVATARERLARFLEREHRAGARCVVVVHGRGRHSDGPPVVKDAVIAALSSGPLTRLVRAFVSAAGRHGGTGALYVLFQRKVKSSS